MAFKPNDDFRNVFTDRVVKKARKNSLAFGFGNNAAQSLIQSNASYQIADPQVTIVEEDRDRDSSTGELADYSPLTKDSASLTWIKVEASGNRSFRARIDQRDLDYSAPITLGAIRTEMADSIRLWIDNHVWSTVVAGVPSANKTALDDSSDKARFKLGTKRFTGNDSQKTAFAKSLADWIDNLNMNVVNLDVDPALGEGDTGVPVAVMSPAVFYELEQYILNTNRAHDRIVYEILPNAPQVFQPGSRWKGRYRGVDLYVTPQARFQPTAAGTGNGNVLGFIPQWPWDNAVKTYPMGVSNPDGDSRKYRFAQELEAWVRVVEGKYLWSATFDTVA